MSALPSDSGLGQRPTRFYACRTSSTYPSKRPSRYPKTLTSLAFCRQDSPTLGYMWFAKPSATITGARPYEPVWPGTPRATSSLITETSLRPGETALRQMAAARVRRNSGCNGVAGECNSVAGECHSVAHFDRPARAPAARARGRASAAADSGEPETAR